MTQFRLVDLLVLASLPLLTMAVLAPAIQAARESSRYHHCHNHLRQIGVALQGYHDRFGKLPPATVQPSKNRSVVMQGTVREAMVASHENWAILLLPFVGAEDLWNSFEPAMPICDAANERMRTTELPLLRCPSDDFSSSENRYVCYATNIKPFECARGNYAINAGTSYLSKGPGTLTSPNPSSRTVEVGPQQIAWWGNGVAGINRSFSYQDCRNGMATTVAIDEIRAGIADVDCRGVWALGEIGASITYAHGLYGDAGRPNPTHVWADDTFGCRRLTEVLGIDRIAEHCMTCCDHMTAHYLQAGARSMHPGGINVLMLDGAVHFVHNEVDPNIWHIVHSRDTPEPIELSALSESLPGHGTTADMVLGSDLEAAANQKRNEPGAPNAMTNSVGIELVEIPAGSFIMGLSDRGEDAPPEVPPHRVTIGKPFYLSRYEVSVQEFAAVTGSVPEKPTVNDDDPVLPAVGAPDATSVRHLTWLQADGFCRRLSDLPAERQAGRTYRLPTEAEWEYACRAGSLVPWQAPAEKEPVDKATTDAEADATGVEGPSAVDRAGSIVRSPFANAFGLHDMETGVWELCADWHARDYYRWSPSRNPTGPLKGVMHVVRGTSWIFRNNPCRLTLYPIEPWRKNPLIGFRVACDVTEPAGVEQ